MKRKYCERAFTRATFYPDGEVWPCPWMHVPLGNIITEEVSELWNSKNAHLARESIMDGSFRYCRKESCHFLENNNLPMVDEEEFERLSQIHEFPLDLMISYEKTCNHMCPSCRFEIYVPDESEKKGFEITAEKLKKIINKANSFDANGCGEVFTSKTIMELLNYARPENKDFLLTLETNGVLFTPENWAKISHFKDYRIEVTITPNSFERDTYKYLSGGHDNLDKLIENLHFVKSLRKAGDLDSVELSIVVQDRNFRELPSFTKRCLEEFEADKVVIKPIYQWFGMKEDVYWFKNVRNPLHPYHNEWLEMMKDPILDNPRVFHWGGRSATEAKTHPAYKHQINQEILLKLLNASNPGERLKTALVENKSVAVCAPDDETGLLLADILKEEGMKVCFLRRFTPPESEKNGLPSYGFPDMDFSSVDTIVITDHYNLEKLTTDIRNHNFNGEILSFKQLSERIEA